MRVFGRRFWFLLLPLAACGTAGSVADVQQAPRGDGGDAPVGAGPPEGGGGAAGDGGSAGGVPDGGAPSDVHRVLFVGNSYIYTNDVAGHYRSIASAFLPAVQVEQVTAGGYKLVQHAEDAETDGTPLAHWLRTGPADEPLFDAVVLQEQSQVGGFAPYAEERKDSILAASELAALATARGAMVVLYLTWGYQHGDEPNALIGYGAYTGMQDALDEGYLGLAALLGEQGANVRVAPVGGGFRTVFEDVTAAGDDPLAEGSDFDALYEADGSHPSLQGAYLAACIIAGTITGEDVTDFVDEPELGAETSNRLRDVCARTLAEPRWSVPEVRRPEAVVVGDVDSSEAFGTAVALSGDGTRAIVGARGLPPTNRRSARVFVRNGADWTEEALFREDAFRLGSVALSGDGSWALVSAADASARSYQRDGSTWTEAPTLELDSTGENCTPTGLSLNADGSRAVMGGSLCYLDLGTESVPARVFAWSGDGWIEEAELPPQVSPVAIDAKGQRFIAVSDSALAHVFVRTDAGWIEEAALLVSDAPPMTGVGPVAISSEGDRALVVLPELDRAVIFARSGTTWAEEATLRGAAFSGYGGSVALSADWKRAAVGHPEDVPVPTGLKSGSVRVFEENEGTFRERFLLVPQEGGVADAFGTSLAISTDGTTVLVGAPRVDSEDGEHPYAGAAYTFTLP